MGRAKRGDNPLASRLRGTPSETTFQVRRSSQPSSRQPAPSATARLVAGQLWPGVQFQTKIAPGVFHFSCAGHGGVIAVIGEADLPASHIEVARKRGLTELVVVTPSRRYTSLTHKRDSLEELARRGQPHSRLIEVWAGEEDCDWATIFHANPALLGPAKEAGVFGGRDNEQAVQESMERWNEGFLADLDPDYQPIPGGQLETEAASAT